MRVKRIPIQTKRSIIITIMLILTLTKRANLKNNQQTKRLTIAPVNSVNIFLSQFNCNYVVLMMPKSNFQKSGYS